MKESGSLPRHGASHWPKKDKAKLNLLEIHSVLEQLFHQYEGTPERYAHRCCFPELLILGWAVTQKQVTTSSIFNHAFLFDLVFMKHLSFGSSPFLTSIPVPPSPSLQMGKMPVQRVSDTLCILPLTKPRLRSDTFQRTPLIIQALCPSLQRVKPAPKYPYLSRQQNVATSTRLWGEDGQHLTITHP